MNELREFGENPTIDSLNTLLGNNSTFKLEDYGRCEYTPLAVAIERRASDLVEEILRRAPQMANQGCRNGTTSYAIQAVWTGDPQFAFKTIRLLREKYQASINCANQFGRTVLAQSAMDSKMLPLTLYLIKNYGVIYNCYREKELSNPKLSEETKDRIRQQPENIARALCLLEQIQEYSLQGYRLYEGISEDRLLPGYSFRGLFPLVGSPELEVVERESATEIARGCDGDH